MQHKVMDDVIALADWKIESESVPRFYRHVYLCCLRPAFRCIRHGLGAPLYSALLILWTRFPYRILSTMMTLSSVP